MPVFTETKATTLKQYISITTQIQQTWAHGDYLPDPWFRGVVDARHTLLPGFFRIDRNAGVDEGDLRDEFARRAPPLLDGHNPNDRWDWYFLMQHYGLPTRLLDWSESSLIGLYFAVADYRRLRTLGAQDAAVWMLDPWYLNQWSIRKDRVFRYDSMRVSPYLPDRLWDNRKIPQKPVAIVPTYNSRRITAQRGIFTLHGKQRQPLEAMLPRRAKPHFTKITIPRKSISAIRSDLRLAGISDVIVFPELPFLCVDILHFWGI